MYLLAIVQVSVQMKDAYCVFLMMIVFFVNKDIIWKVGFVKNVLMDALNAMMV